MTIALNYAPLANLDSADRYAEAIARATALGWVEGLAFAASGLVENPSNPLASTTPKRCPVKAQWTGRKVLSAIRVVQSRGFHRAAARAAFAHAFDGAIVTHFFG